MKEFYLHIDGAQQGPFSLDELRGKAIARGTLVWFTGADDWIPVNSVDELTHAIRTGRPSPGRQASHPAPLISGKQANATVAATGGVRPPVRRWKAPLALIIGGLGLILATAGLMHAYQQRQYEELVQQVEVQRVILEQQSAKIQAYEKRESQRRAEEARRKRAERLQQLHAQYEAAEARLRLAQEKLDEIREFHFLRSDAEREEQMQAQLEEIRSCQDAIANIRREISRN